MTERQQQDEQQEKNLEIKKIESSLSLISVGKPVVPVVGATHYFLPDVVVEQFFPFVRFVHVVHASVGRCGWTGPTSMSSSSYYRNRGPSSNAVRSCSPRRPASVVVVVVAVLRSGRKRENKNRSDSGWLAKNPCELARAHTRSTLRELITNSITDSGDTAKIKPTR